MQALIKCVPNLEEKACNKKKLTNKQVKEKKEKKNHLGVGKEKTDNLATASHR